MNFIVNDRIHLSELLPSDQPACVEHFKEREIYDRTIRIPYPYTAADFQTWLAIVENAKKEQGQQVHWAIRNDNTFLIGGCGFNNLQVGKSHRAEIGYWLAKPYWGQGIMTAVVRTLCNHGFEQLGLVKIEAHVFADNTASAKVLQKCGFQQEGFLRKHYFKDGKFIDARLFALVRDGGAPWKP